MTSTKVWASHVVGRAHAPEDPLRQGRLAGTQVAGEQEDVARPSVFADNPAKLMGVFRACGLYLDCYWGQWAGSPNEVHVL